MITPNKIYIPGLALSNMDLFREYKLCYLRLEKLLLQSLSEVATKTEKLELRNHIKNVGKTYLEVKNKFNKEL